MLSKWSVFSNLPAFLDLNGSKIFKYFKTRTRREVASKANDEQKILSTKITIDPNSYTDATLVKTDAADLVNIFENSLCLSQN